MARDSYKNIKYGQDDQVLGIVEKAPIFSQLLRFKNLRLMELWLLKFS